jgi:hypothetical protein
MPSKTTVRKARQANREGKAPSTQAGEFVREEIHHVRQGKHGARSAKQAIAIGLSKARRSGVKLSPPKKGKVTARTQKAAQRDYQLGQSKTSSRKASPRRSRSASAALQREGTSSASRAALSRNARQVVRRKK